MVIRGVIERVRAKCLSVGVSEGMFVCDPDGDCLVVQEWGGPGCGDRGAGLGYTGCMAPGVENRLCPRGVSEDK